MLFYQGLYMSTLDSIQINGSNQKKNICSEVQENLIFGSDLHNLVPGFMEVYK